MFPARAGMNRLGTGGGSVGKHVPRTRGDEPASLAGGYDGEFTSDTGVTRIKGNMFIRQGMIRVKKVGVH